MAEVHAPVPPGTTKVEEHTMLGETTTTVDLSEELAEMTVVENAESQKTAEDTWFPAAHQILTAEKATEARQWITRRREGMRSWREFAKTDKFRLPAGISSITRRIIRNVEYFQSNYICIFVVLFFYCVLTSPMLLVAFAACFGILYFIRARNLNGRMIVAGREVSPAYQYGIVAALSFPLFYLAGAGSVIFWVIGASIFVILVHALFYASDPVPGADFEVEQV